MTKQGKNWDVFCRVVDNFGDAAVCWRLARQLHAEHDLNIRLWIDDLATLRILVPEIQADIDEQCMDGVRVHRWCGTSHASSVDVVIEAFGCGLDESYQSELARANPDALWIILEYLSAESWVGSHHGLPSPHPRLALRRFFFIPGFARNSGGLLRERALMARRDHFLRDRKSQAGLWRSLGLQEPLDGVTKVSLFGYENAAIGELLETWSTSRHPVLALIPPSPLRAAIEAWCRGSHSHSGPMSRQGQLEVQFIPFLPQKRYDELLWACDWNFVRGEDSFVRAQWAARPMVWHIYPQDGNAHLVKLQAFLDLYLEGMAKAHGSAMRELWLRWNGASAVKFQDSWANLELCHKVYLDQSVAWCEYQMAKADLAQNLVQFCRSKVQ